MITANIQFEQVGVVCHSLAKDGKSGNVAWFTSPIHMAEGTRIFIMPPLPISPQPAQSQPETNLPISGLGGYDQVLRDEFEDGKK
jgi:hypothetical protein